MRTLILATLGMVGLTLSAIAPATANDTMSQLGTGGLIFLTSGKVAMQSEDLYVSMDEVRVAYEFRNDGETDETALVAFPLPDITGSGDFMVSIPTNSTDNIFGFTTTFNGEPVEVTQHQYVFAFGVDHTALLQSLNVPLAPFSTETQEALDALSDEDKAVLLHNGLVIPMEYDIGEGMQTSYVPVWTLKTTYTWEAEFKAGEVAEVVHTYRPSVGGTTGVTFLAPPYEGYDPAREYAGKYCTDESFLSAVRKTLPNPDEPYGAPFFENWLTYIWSTGNNWNGPIENFHLTIDKGRPENLVSFCWDGEVTKTSPTTFEMDAKDFYPPYGRELEVLILNRQIEQNVG